jgi:energy-coupling factor transporter ATP-binding protein EcfA2
MSEVVVVRPCGGDECPEFFTPKEIIEMFAEVAHWSLTEITNFPYSADSRFWVFLLTTNPNHLCRAAKLVSGVNLQGEVVSGHGAGYIITAVSLNPADPALRKHVPARDVLVVKACGRTVFPGPLTAGDTISMFQQVTTWSLSPFPNFQYAAHRPYWIFLVNTNSNSALFRSFVRSDLVELDGQIVSGLGAACISDIIHDFEVLPFDEQPPLPRLSVPLEQTVADIRPPTAPHVAKFSLSEQDEDFVLVTSPVDISVDCLSDSKETQNRAEEPEIAVMAGADWTDSERGSSTCEDDEDDVLLSVPARDELYFMDDSATKTCEILLLQIQYFIQKETCFAPDSEDATRICALLGQLQERLKLEPRLVSHGRFCQSSIAEFIGDVRKFASLSGSAQTSRNGQRDKKLLVSKVNEWLSTVRPVDIGLLLSLIAESVKCARALKKKDVVLVMGPTGVGKSTLIRFLAGSVFTVLKKTRDSTEYSIEPSKLCDTSGVSTSNRFKSATRYINPVEIPPEALEVLGLKDAACSVFLVDTPGFGDTNGPEVDIANSMGTIKAVQKCNSVKIVFVCDNQMGSRGDKLKETVLTLIRMLGEDIESHFESIQLAFTKFEEEDTVVDQLDKLIEAGRENRGENNGAYLTFLDILAEKSQTPCLVKPETESPESLLRAIAGMTAVANPHEVFTEFLTDKSDAKLRHQLGRHEDYIKASLRRNELDSVISKLKELHEINKIVNFELGRNAEERCVALVQEFLVERIRQFDIIFDAVKNSKEQVDVSDKSDLTAVCKELVSLNHLKGFLDAEDFVAACSLKIEKFAVDTVQSFDETLDMIFPNTEQQVHRLSPHFDDLPSGYEIAMEASRSNLNRLIDVVGILQDIDLGSNHLQTELGKHVDSMKLRLRMRLAAVMEAVSHETVGSHLIQYDVVVNALVFLKQACACFEIYLPAEWKRIMTQCVGPSLNFEGRITAVIAALDRIDQLAPEELRQLMSDFEMLETVAKIPSIGALVDKKKLQSQLSSAVDQFRRAASSLFSQLSELTRESECRLDYGAIAFMAQRCHMLRNFVNSADDWVVALRRQIEGCIVTVISGFDKLLTGNREAVALGKITIALANLSSAYRELQHLTTVGFDLANIDNFVALFSERLSRLQQEIDLIKHGLEIDVGGGPIRKAKEPARFVKMLYIVDECEKLDAEFRRDYGLTMNASSSQAAGPNSIESAVNELKRIQCDFTHGITAAYVDICVAFYCDGSDVKIDIPGLQEVACVVDELCSYNRSAFGDQRTKLSTAFSKKCTGFKESISTSLFQNWEILVRSLNSDTSPSESDSRDAAKRIYDVLESLTGAVSCAKISFACIEGAATELFNETFRSFPSLLLASYLSESGRIITLVRELTASNAEALKANQFDRMKQIAAVARAAADWFDPIVTHSSCNSYPSFSGYQQLARQISDSIMKITNDGKARINLAIGQSRFEEAVAEYKSCETQLPQEDRSELVRNLTQSGKFLVEKFHKALGRASLEKFSARTYLQLQLEVIEIGKFAVACCDAVLETESFHDHKDICESNLQNYFCAQIEKLFTDAYAHENFVELESLLAQVTEVLPKVLVMHCRVKNNEFLCAEASDASRLTFGAWIESLAPKLGEQILALADTCAAKVMHLDITQFRTYPPATLLTAFSHCAAQSTGHAAKYKALYDTLTAEIISRVTNYLSFSSTDNTDFVPLEEYEERVTLVSQMQASMVAVPSTTIQAKLVEATDYIARGKATRESAKLQFQSISDTRKAIGEYRNYIERQDFQYAGSFRFYVMSLIRRAVLQYQDYLKRGNVGEGIALGALVFDTLSHFVEVTADCRLMWSEPQVARVPIKQDAWNHWTYVFKNQTHFLRNHEVTEQMRKTFRMDLQIAPATKRFPHLFHDEDLRQILDEVKATLSSRLVGAINALEAMTAENMEPATQHIPVLIKLLGTQLSCPGYYVDAIQPFVAKINAALQNFDGKLIELSNRLDEAFTSGSVPVLKKSIETAQKVETTLEVWAPFSTGSHFSSLPRTGTVDLGALMYARLQVRLDNAIQLWVNSLTAEQYLHHRETETRSNADRDAFYKAVNRMYKSVLEVDRISYHSRRSAVDIAELKKRCRAHVTAQVFTIVNHLEDLITQIPCEEDAVYIDFENTYDNLRAIEENFEVAEIANEVRKSMNKIRNRFFALVRDIQDNALTVTEKSINHLKPHDIEECINKLIQLKAMSNLLACFARELDDIIDETNDLLRMQLEGAKRFGMITVQLQSRVEGKTGAERRSHMHIQALLQHAAFDGIANVLRVKRTKQFTIHNVLGFENPPEDDPNFVRVDSSSLSSCICGTNIDFQLRVNLLHHFQAFDDLYWGLVKDGIRKDSKESQMEFIRDQVESKLLKCNSFPTEEIRFRHLVAYIFAYWTLSKFSGFQVSASSAPASNQSKRGNNSSSAAETEHSVEEIYDSLVQPHPAQVVALFRLFGIDNRVFESTDSAAADEDTSLLGSLGSVASSLQSLVGSAASFLGNYQPPGFKRHLVEVLTGEGKSVILAIASTLLALLGYTVHCACYSPYLSRRDFDDFQNLFQGFRVNDFIEYGTFGSLCEKILDADGDIRKTVSSLLCQSAGNDSYLRLANSASSNRKKILLIDEVDVFFSTEYYGRLYEPYATVATPGLANMAVWLWQNRKAKDLNWRAISSCDVYKACMKEFGAHSDVAIEIVKGMLLDLKTVTSPTYVKDYCVVEIRGSNYIGYKEQDCVNINIIKGYQTMFHYMREYEAKVITQQTLHKALVGRLYCGGFSYAEIPNEYDCLMGVTGTLKQVCEGPQRDLLDKYKFTKYSYIPSVYGSSKRIFQEDNDLDVKMIENVRYHAEIVEQIEARIRSMHSSSDYRRAVLVFFESIEALEAFRISRNFVEYRQHAIVITETTSTLEKEGRIKAAAKSGQIVLLTKIFGRGTDFICYDENLLAAGGVHVLQTFLSEQNTEELQIMGRTARQGNTGSYSMVLKIEDLEKFHISPQMVADIKKSGKLYGSLARARDKYFREEIYPLLKKGIDDIEGLYKESRAFVVNLLSQNKVEAKKYLIKYNRVLLAEGSKKFRIVVLMDATGSMSSLLLLAKNSVKAMFNRLHEFIRSQNISGEILLQYAVYRNYNAPPEKLLEFSDWEPLSENPNRLFSFMDRIKADYGIDNEAVEVGLGHALAEDAVESINAVVLIGDTPPNLYEHVHARREQHRPGGWGGTRFSTPLYYEELLPKFAAKSIPIYTFWVHSGAATAYTKIAVATNGNCQELDVKAPDAGNKLCDCVSMQISRAVGGEELVNAFRRAYNIPAGYIG